VFQKQKEEIRYLVETNINSDYEKKIKERDKQRDLQEQARKKNMMIIHQIPKKNSKRESDLKSTFGSINKKNDPMHNIRKNLETKV
jgi:hypothetical protein